jgi:hypothetical protein
VINVVSSDEVTSTVMGYADECSGEHSHEYGSHNGNPAFGGPYQNIPAEGIEPSATRLKVVRSTKLSWAGDVVRKGKWAGFIILLFSFFFNKCHLPRSAPVLPQALPNLMMTTLMR